MVTTVVPVAVLLIALVTVSVFGFTRLTQTLVEQRDSELVQLAARQVAGYWADSVRLLIAVSSTDPVRSGDLGAIKALLSESVALYQRFDQISITDVQGVVVATEGGVLGESVGQYAYFERARRLRRPVRSEVYKDAQGQQVIVVAVPIYDWAGRFSGCALGVWELQKDHLGLPVRNVRVGQNGFAQLLDSRGIVLYHPSKDMIGADYHQHPAVAALLRGETGAQTVNVGGQTMVVGYAPLRLRELASSLADESWDGWGLVTVEFWDDIVAPLRPYVRLMAVLLVLVVTIPLTFLALNSRRIIAPLQSLVAQAERVASGEFETQVSVNTGPSEVRELELAFNTMVDQLRKYRSDIQSYIISILNSQEDERKRIARELHDETAQALIVLGRRIEMAEELSDNAELTAQLESLRDLVDDTLQGVRLFTRDLRPPLLEELGLPRTLELLGDRIAQEQPLTVNVTIKGEPRPLLPEVELGLYRLAQESLSNVRRHAHATRVEIGLTYEENRVRLEITDDGVGFEAPKNPAELIKSGRLGLMGIYERARLFGGQATITSKPGQGTQVVVEVPLTAIVLSPQAGIQEKRSAEGRSE